MAHWATPSDSLFSDESESALGPQRCRLVWRFLHTAAKTNLRLMLQTSGAPGRLTVCFTWTGVVRLAVSGSIQTSDAVCARGTPCSNTLTMSSTKLSLLDWEINPGKADRMSIR